MIAEARGTDREFLMISDTLPGFAGFYVTSGGIIRVLTNGSQSAAEIAPFVTSHLRPDERRLSVEVGPAAFPFAVLYTWKEIIHGMGASGGLVTLGIDIARNALRVRVRDATAREGVEALAAHHGIPRPAILIEEVGNDYFHDVTALSSHITTPGPTSLRALRNPLSGGWQVTWWEDGSTSGTCTIAATLRQGLNRVFLTASHCGRRFAMTGTRFDQPVLGSKIGVESWDATWRPPSTGVCTWGADTVCRYSDAVVGLYDEAARGQLGTVGKPMLRNPSYSDPNVVTVDGLDATFSIAGTYPYPHQGETVERVGRTTGWQSGTVVEPCTNVYRTDNATNKDFVLLCQYHVTATTGTGDSGGPAFFHNPEMNSVTLVGVVWSGAGLDLGLNSEGNRIWSEMWMSSWEDISIDYPGLSIQ